VCVGGKETEEKSKRELINIPVHLIKIKRLLG